MLQCNSKIRMPRSHEFDGRGQRIFNDQFKNINACNFDTTDSTNNGDCDISQERSLQEGDTNVIQCPDVSQNNLKLSPTHHKCTKNNAIEKDSLDKDGPEILKKLTSYENVKDIMTKEAVNILVQINHDDNQNKKKVPIHVGKELSDHYNTEKMIGRGKFGKVYKVTHKETERLAAAKEIQYNSSKAKEEILYEIDILSQLSENEYIVNLFEVFDCCTCRPGKMTIVTEYLDGGDLFSEIAKEEILTESQVIKLIIQIVKGVSFIHNNEIIHRDLKPDNIIYCSKSNDKIKIIDFGLAVRFDKTRPPKSMVGTTLFVAPEVLKFENQSYQTDIWSVGVIAFDLLTGITPFEIPRSGDLDRELTDEEIMINIERCQYDFEDDGFIGVSEEAKSFISSILVIDPEKRLTTEDCLQHPWLKALDHVDFASTARSVSVQRMKNYVALKKWEKISLAIQSINCFKASIDHG